VAETPVLQVSAGTVVTLDGRASTDSGPGAAPGVRYTWRQVSGPQVALSDPFSPVTTFVTPDLPGSQTRGLYYELYVDDGATRSEPSPVRVQVVPKDLPSASVPLAPGLNFVGLPVAPRGLLRAYSVSDLLRDSGAGLAAVPLLGRPAGFRVFLPGDLAADTLPVQGNQGYLLLRSAGGQTATTLTLRGDAWDAALLRRTVEPGLNLLHLPRGVPDSFTVATLLALPNLSAVTFAAVLDGPPGPNRALRVYLPGTGMPAPPLAAGQAVLLFHSGPAAVTVDLPQR
jgi:hypothetical protein